MNEPCFPKRIGTLLLALLYHSLLFTHAQAPEANKVRADFKALLQRPIVDLNPSVEVQVTDSMIIEKGFFIRRLLRKFQC